MHIIFTSCFGDLHVIKCSCPWSLFSPYAAVRKRATMANFVGLAAKNIVIKKENCFHQVIETQVEAWENKICCGSTS